MLTINPDLDDLLIAFTSATKTFNLAAIKNSMVFIKNPEMKADFEKRLEPKGIPLDVINMADYGMMNGEKILKHAIKLIKSNK